MSGAGPSDSLDMQIYNKISFGLSSSDRSIRRSYIPAAVPPSLESMALIHYHHTIILDHRIHIAIFTEGGYHYYINDFLCFIRPEAVVTKLLTLAHYIRKHII